MRPKKPVAIFCVDPNRAGDLRYVLEQRCLTVRPHVVRDYARLLNDAAEVFVLIDAPDEARELVFRCKRVLQVRQAIAEDDLGLFVRDGDVAGLIERLVVMLRRKRGPRKKAA